MPASAARNASARLSYSPREILLFFFPGGLYSATHLHRSERKRTPRCFLGAPWLSSPLTSKANLTSSGIFMRPVNASQLITSSCRTSESVVCVGESFSFEIFLWKKSIHSRASLASDSTRSSAPASNGSGLSHFTFPPPNTY